MNVLMGRYKVITKEVKDYFYGLYGRPSAPVERGGQEEGAEGLRKGGDAHRRPARAT